MRFKTLELLAFGPFTQLEIDLAATPGLHLIYGPNEAGKSSALRALTDLLFGIKATTTDHFIHDFRDMRVGARLELADGSSLHLRRRKGNKDTLLDAGGNPLDDGVLEPFLGGVSRELFQSMFGINHAQLVAGGQEILSNEGEVGRAMFAAGTGFVQLRELGDSLKGEADALFKRQAQKPVLNQLIKEYAEVRKARDQVTLRGADWKRHQDALRDATEHKDRLTRTRQEKLSEQSRLQRIRQALPLLAERREWLVRVAALADAVLLPDDFAQRRISAYEALEAAKRDEARLAGDLARTLRELEALALEPAVLAHAAEIARLYRSAGQYARGKGEVATLRLKLAAAEQAAQTRLREVRPDLTLQAAEHQLRLQKARRDRIRELGNQYQARLEGPRAQRRAADALAVDLEQKRIELAALPAARDPELLRRAVEQAQKAGDLEAQAAEAERKLLAEREQAALELSRLGQWQGDLAHLERVPLPAQETLERFQVELDGLELKRRSLEEQLDQARGRVADAERELEAFRRAGEVPSEDELEEVRALRDRGWQLVRRAWLEGDVDAAEQDAYDAERSLPEAYERRVNEADEVADRLRREAGRVEKQAMLRTALDQQEAGCGRLSEALLQVEQARLEVEVRWRQLWLEAGITPLSPREMRSWLSRYKGLMDRAGRIRELEAARQTARERIEVCCRALAAGLDAVGEPAAGEAGRFDLLTARATAVLNAVEDAGRRRRALEEAVAELEKKRVACARDVEEAEQALGEWRQAWGEAVRVLGLEPHDLPAQANTALTQIEELCKGLDDAAELRARIEGLEQEIGQFEREVAGLCERLAPELSEHAPDDAATSLHARWQGSSQEAARREELEKKLRDQGEQQARARAAREAAEDRLAVCLTEAGCDAYEQLKAVEDRSSQRREAERGLQVCEKRLLEIGAGRTLDQLVAESAAIDADGLPGQLEALEAALKALDDARSGLDQQIGREREVLEQMNGTGLAGEHAEAAQALLASMRAHSQRYLLLKLAAAVLEREIDAWRERNQNPLLTRAGEVFERLTLGGFTGLESSFNDKDQQVLQGVRADGRRVGVDGMSEGTRDQLFLALRVASLEQYLARNEALPLIVDDLLINFDDGRSLATLKVLDELSRRTQVIFFTHHRHLVEMAQRGLEGGVQVQTLGGPL